MTQAITTTPTVKPEVAFGNNGVRLNSLEDAYRFSKCVAVSGWAPKGMDKPESILIALQHAAELGLPPLAGLQNIAVINGKPGIYGDAALALVRKSGLLESYKEEEVGTRGKDDWGIRVTVKRVGNDLHSDSFTVADAKAAGLWGKAGPWTQYPKRMLKFRARGFVLRDIFGDVLKGLHTVEELQDLPEKNVTPARSLSSVIAGDPEPADEAAQPAELDREKIVSQIENILLDSGASEELALKSAMSSGIVENADGLALFELPTADLSRVAAYLSEKSAAQPVKGGA